MLQQSQQGTILDDWTLYHPRIWSNGDFQSSRDEAEEADRIYRFGKAGGVKYISLFLCGNGRGLCIYLTFWYIITCSPIIAPEGIE
jgi:hypothetical protein